MTDAGLIAKRLARIETCLADLHLVDPGAIEHDVIRERFVEHTLQIAIQAAVDVAAHIVADDHLGDPTTNHGLFDLLHRHGWIPDTLLPALHRMVGFRNVLVHAYEDVDVRLVRRVVEFHTGDLLAFVAAMRRRIGPPTPGE